MLKLGYKEYNGNNLDEFHSVFFAICSQNVDLNWLTLEEAIQISTYFFVYKHYGLRQHWEVNNKISEDGTWDIFSKIRSLNNHGNGKIVKGIQPKYFRVFLSFSKLQNLEGDSLLKFEKY